MKVNSRRNTQWAKLSVLFSSAYMEVVAPLTAAASEELPWRGPAADPTCEAFNGSNAFYAHISCCWSCVQRPAGARCGGVLMTKNILVSGAIQKKSNLFRGSCELHSWSCVLQVLIYVKWEMIPR